MVVSWWIVAFLLSGIYMCVREGTCMCVYIISSHGHSGPSCSMWCAFWCYLMNLCKILFPMCVYLKGRYIL